MEKGGASAPPFSFGHLYPQSNPSQPAAYPVPVYSRPLTARPMALSTSRRCEP